MDLYVTVCSSLNLWNQITLFSGGPNENGAVVFHDALEGLEAGNNWLCVPLRVARSLRILQWSRSRGFREPHSNKPWLSPLRLLGGTATDGLLTSFVFYLCFPNTILQNIRTQIARWLLKLMNWNDVGTRVSVVGWGTTLQAGRSPVRFPIRLLVLLIDVILPAAL
jgi:hypothetical protein